MGHHGGSVGVTEQKKINHKNQSFKQKRWRTKVLGIIPESITYFQNIEKSINPYIKGNVAFMPHLESF